MTVKHSSPLTCLRFAHIRIQNEWVLVKLQNEMRSWLPRFLTYKSRLKTRNSFGRWLFSSSSDWFRSNIDCTIFFVAFLDRRELSQIQTRTLYGEVTGWNVKLVVLILRYKSRLKTRNSFYKLVFALSEVVFVRRLTVQHSLPPSWLDVSCFRLKRGHFLMNLQFEVIFWLPRFCHPNHDWKLNIHFENGCLHPKGFELCSEASQATFFADF